MHNMYVKLNALDGSLRIGHWSDMRLCADGNHQNQRDIDEIDSEEPSLSANTTKSSSTESVQARGTPPRTASIRARPTSSRITAAELEELFARQGPAPPSPAGSTTPRTPRVYASVAEMKRSRGKVRDSLQVKLELEKKCSAKLRKFDKSLN